MEWRLWFVQLSGWPVFLATVAGVFVLMLGLSVVLTRISHRSVLQNALLAVISVAAIACALVILVAVLTRR
jgi:hypothetical protein